MGRYRLSFVLTLAVTMAFFGCVLAGDRGKPGLKIEPKKCGPFCNEEACFHTEARGKELTNLNKNEELLTVRRMDNQTETQSD